MKQLLFFLCIFSLTLVSAADIPPAQDLYVNDFAHVLSESSAQFLHTMFSEVNENTTAEIVFVSMETIEGEDISEYATRLGQEWGVGKEDMDNGLVILYVKDINKIWVATGYGLEGILPDSKIGRLLDENYVPARDEGNVEEGIVLVSTALSQVVVEHGEEIRSGRATPSISPFTIFLLIFVIFIIISLIIRAFASRRPGMSGLWWIPIFLPSGRSSGGYGGFGGGGFGGGGFGGGGAGR